MSRTKHYEAAEYWVSSKDRSVPTFSSSNAPLLDDPRLDEIARAQVHATLALVDVMERVLEELAARRQPTSGNEGE